MGAGLHLLPQAACSCPPHRHAPQHVVKSLEASPLNPSRPTGKKKIPGKWPE